MAGEKKYIALEATSQEIRAIGYNTANRIGDQSNETGGSATTGTVFAKLNKLIEQLTTVVSSVGNCIDGLSIIHNILGSSTASDNTVVEMLNQILNLMSAQTGVIRHIQRGTIKDTDKTGVITVSLAGFTNLDKMFVLINGHIFHGSGIYQPSWATIASTTELRVGVATSSNYLTHIEYQVIETY